MFTNEPQRFSEQEIKQIRQEIGRGDLYKNIIEKWNIKSTGFISMINTGKRYYDPSLHYPLRVSKYGNSTKYLEVMHYLIWDLIPKTKANLYASISEKTGYGVAAIKKNDLGYSHKDDTLKYPLSNYQKENQLLFKKNVVSTISD